MHKMHEHGGYIDQAKRHHSIFKMTLPCPEGHLPLIAGMNLDQVVGPLQVQLHEDLSLTEPLNQFRNEGKRVPVPYCNCIQFAVITAQVQLPQLLNKEQGTANGEVEG